MSKVSFRNTRDGFTQLYLYINKDDDKFPAGSELACILLVNNSNVSYINKSNGVRKETLQRVRRMAQISSSFFLMLSVKFNQKSHLKDHLKSSETCK